MIAPRRIAFLWSGAQRSENAVSGMPFAMATTLSALGHDVVDVFADPSDVWMREVRHRIGNALPPDLKRALQRRRERFRTIGESLHSVRTGRAILREAHRRSAAMIPQIERIEPDIVFGCCASTILCGLRTSLPIVYFSDTTAKLIMQTYPRYQRRSAAHHRACDSIEREALANVTLAAFATPIAQRSAVEDYGATPDRAVVVPMGANITEKDLQETPIERAAISRGRLHICHIAADPERKRTAFAVEVVKTLRRRGWRAELTVIGAATRETARSMCYRHAGMLRLSEPAERARLAHILSRSHLLLMPSSGEAFGIAACEAAHFGVPAIVSDVGGLPHIVLDGVTGCVLREPANADEYADSIIRLASDKDRYQQISENARQRAHSEFTWKRWGERMSVWFEHALTLEPRNHPLLRETTPSASTTGSEAPRAGFEPATCDLEDRCSVQLSYRGE